MFHQNRDHSALFSCQNQTRRQPSPTSTLTIVGFDMKMTLHTRRGITKTKATIKRTTMTMMMTIETTLTTLTSRSLRQMFIEHNQISWEQQQDAEPQQ